MLSYITEPLRKLFSTRDAERYKRKRSKTSMTIEIEEGEPSSKRFQRSALGSEVSSARQPRHSYISGSLPFGNCIQDWIARIGQMAAKPIVPINIGDVREADEFPDDDHEDQDDDDDGNDSEVEIIEAPLQVNGKGGNNLYAQALTREPLHSGHIANGHGKKHQENWQDVDEDLDVMVIPTSQNGIGSVHHKNLEDEGAHSEDSSPQSSEPSYFKKYYGHSKQHLKAKTPLESYRLGEKEQYRMLIEQCKVESQIESRLSGSRPHSSMRQSENVKHGVSMSKLSSGNVKSIIDRLHLGSDSKQRLIHKGNGIAAKDTFNISKFLPLKPGTEPSRSIVGKMHPRHLDAELGLRNGSVQDFKLHDDLWKRPLPNVPEPIVGKLHRKLSDPDVNLRKGIVKQLQSHREPWEKPSPCTSARNTESVRPKMFPVDRRSSLPSYDKPKFSQAWLNDLQMSIDDCVSDRAQKEELLEKSVREMRDRREAKIFAVNRKALLRLAKTQKLKSTDASEEEEDKSHFPDLTPEMERKVEEVLRPTPPEEVLCEGFRLSIARRDMETLSGLNWLNDEIINFYMNLVMERGKNDNFPSVYAFNTFFYPKLISGGHAALRRWTRQVDIFSYHYVLIPVHLGMHWCLAVIDFKQKKIQYYDSMGGQNNECVNALKTYLHDERKDKKKEEYDMSDWKFETVKNIPQQMNGSDCGMFTLKYAEYITRNAKITFSQRHMPYFRRRMVYEILMKTLL